MDKTAMIVLSIKMIAFRLVLLWKKEYAMSRKLCLPQSQLRRKGGTVMLTKQFEELYGAPCERILFSPGRVNLIGEHTDYNGGYVFPAAIGLGSTLLYRKREDGIIRLKATDLPDMVEAEVSKLDSYKDLKWGNYQLGIFDTLQKMGYEISGCDLLYDDTIPHGGGLSSSAAIEVVTALLVSLLNGEQPDMVKMAKISQKMEHEYIGVKCGIMDQFSSAMGKANHAIFLNCKTMDYQLVPIEMHGYKLVITNTNKKRSLADSKYNERRGECETAAECLKKALPEITCLADVTPEQFEAHKAEIADEIIRRRAEHVVYEDERVLQSVKVLQAGDLEAFGRLMNASHDSLRDLYEVTGVELDTLVEEARKIDGVLGSRMTGAGFGGCTVSLVREDAVAQFQAEVAKNYEKKIGYAPSFYFTEIGDGGRELMK